MFEQTLAAKRSGRRWRVPLVMAVVAHGVVLVTAVLASTWSIDDVEPPLFPDVILRVEFAPPDLGGGSPPPRPPEPQQSPAPPVKPPEPVAETQPEVVPEASPAQTTPTAETFADPAATGEPTTEGPEGEGVPWGEPGSTGDGDVVGDDVAVPLDARMVPPQTLVRVQPRYPDRARMIRKEGLVVVQATIDRGGRVTDVRLVKGLGYGLDEAALTAVEQWRFRPATLQGRPVPVYFQLSVQFRIQ